MHTKMFPKQCNPHLFKICLVLSAGSVLLFFQSTSIYQYRNIALKSSRIHNEKCEVRNNIAFLKTHKTGGTTLARIIEKHAFDNNLNVVRKIGEGGSIHFGNVNFNFESKKKFLPPMGIESGNYDAYKYNVFTLHARYNRPVFDAFMEPNTLYITLLRDPVTQFESSFDFFHVGSNLEKSSGVVLNKTQKLQLFFEDPIGNWKNLSSTKRKYSYNNQIWDLGINPANIDKDDFLINRTINEVDDRLDFVLINEFYDESLLILKKMLCWQFNDILYLPRNQRGSRADLDTKLTEKIAKWNYVDTKLYRHFLKNLHINIDNYGPTFEDDLAAFKRMTSFLYETCVSHTSIGKKRITYQKGSVNYTNDICQRSKGTLSDCDFSNGYVLTLDLGSVCVDVTSDPSSLNRHIRNMMKGVAMTMRPLHK
ncbi:galactose-3-O-sulfotransferase 2-like [Antedon mediterranea]|uniref:galactose-3-O-sulfotransferase 2-like n=1 Tax=Antedon mediterranea TaxID=105859 RepID=UPI003AF99806